MAAVNGRCAYITHSRRNKPIDGLSPGASLVCGISVALASTMSVRVASVPRKQIVIGEPLRHPLGEGGPSLPTSDAGTFVWLLYGYVAIVLAGTLPPAHVSESIVSRPAELL